MRAQPVTSGGASARETSDVSTLQIVRRILGESPLIDGHNDLAWEFRRTANNQLDAIDLAHDTRSLGLVTDLPRLKAGGIGAQFWSVYVPSELTAGAAVTAVLEQIDVVHRLIASYPENLELALTADDIVRIHRDGKIASLLGLEGGHSIGNSLGTLRMMCALGARYMTLTHIKNNEWADSGTDEPAHHGLTGFGADVVREMNSLGMLADLSHVSDETMAAALKISKAPVIFSHSSARALCHHARNVPDDILKSVAANGGLVMVTFIPEFLTETDRLDEMAAIAERRRVAELYTGDVARIKAGVADWRKTHPAPRAATLLDVADHIDHIRAVAGIDHVGIGSDYEGFDNPPAGLQDVSCYPALLCELLYRGYTEEEIKKVAGQNLLRVLRAAEQTAAQLQAAQRPSSGS